ncbi:hypothetical protein IPC203_24875 [Pseudomonas aeruginosa]|uniref:hypothetical protein n=1 Tax=Pseudomonas aeruginosa TaxID=287 RepID=UPI000F51EFD2|nr:hypothetical protein [Pseudomonas aeruginosa]RQG53728.1 hypothetical protein IPC203_24875 [Pseudomonas aeruginosa]
MSMEMKKALDLLREIRPSIPKEVLELWCKDRDAFLESHPAVEQADASSCQGTNCGTTTGDHSSECLAEAAAGQGWELKPGDLCGRDCPIHKILAEQAGGGERVAFEAYRDRRNALLESDGHNPGSKWHVTNAHYPTWEASRAALAQPSPKCATCNDSGQIVVSGPHYQGEFQPPEYETEPCDMCAQPSPAQAEAERPEVVAYLFVKPDGTLSMDAVRHKPSQPAVAVMTVAQHDRIVGAMRADRDSWAEQAEQRLADWDEMRKERDAALAGVAELEKELAMARDAAAKGGETDEH